MGLRSGLFFTAAGIAALSSSAARADTDLGPTAATKTVTASLVLKVRNPDALEAYVAATQDPYSWQYHRFLSVNEFVNRSRRAITISRIKNYLAKSASR